MTVNILKAIVWGRNIEHNILRSLQYELTFNIVTVSTLFIGYCMTCQPVFQLSQLLLMVFISNKLITLALVSESPDF